jgi:hypothetical protein
MRALQPRLSDFLYELKQGVMMQNKLIDLNNHLFAQIERLGDEEMDREKLEKEIERSKAITSVSKEIVSNARLVLDAHIQNGKSIELKELPETFGR